MGWIQVILVYILMYMCVLLHNKAENLAIEAPKNSKKRRKWEIISNISLGMALAITAAPVLYAIIWVWYYICCGFLLSMDGNSLWDILFYGALSLGLVTYLIGGLLILFGKK